MHSPHTCQTDIGLFAGNIASWKKKEGEEVAAGDQKAEIETDKVNVESCQDSAVTWRFQAKWLSDLC